MRLMLHNETPQDFLIASGQTSSLADFVNLAFSMENLEAQDWICLDPQLMRPADLGYSAMNPSRIEKDLGWRSAHTLREIVAMMHAERVL
jgi:GDPmannose 4,6-dehydratase